MSETHNTLKFNGTVRILSESFGLKKGFVDKDGVFKEATDPKQIKGIRLMGKAITPDVPTRNKVAYSRESLMASHKTLIGKPFLDSHKDDSIRTHPPFGHVVNAYMTDDGLMYEVDIDPAEETFIRKVERGDIKGVSIQVLVSDVEQKEGYVRAHVQEFLELSSVLIPGDGDTSMRLLEAFNMNKKEDIDVKPLGLDIKQSGDAPINVSKPKIQKPEFNQVLNKWVVQYEGETFKFDNEASANAFYDAMTKFQDASPTDKKTEPAFDTVDMMKEKTFKEQDERPPKAWFDKCVKAVRGKADNPEALCGWVWYHHKKAEEMGEDDFVELGEIIGGSGVKHLKEADGGSGAKHLGVKVGDKTIPPSNPKPVVKHDSDEEYDNLRKIPSKPQDRKISDYPPKDIQKKAWTQGCPWCGSKNWRRMSPSEFEIVGWDSEGEDLEGEEGGVGFYYCRNCGTIFEVEDGVVTNVGKPELRKLSDEKPYLGYVKDEALKAKCLKCSYKSHIDNFPDEDGELFCPKCQEKDIEIIK